MGSSRDPDSRVTDDALLAEQIRYNDQRAPIYEQLYFRQGRYAVDDPAFLDTWHRETAALERFTQAVAAGGSVLELNRARVADDRVAYVLADLFSWNPTETGSTSSPSASSSPTCRRTHGTTSRTA